MRSGILGEWVGCLGRFGVVWSWCCLGIIGLLLMGLGARSQQITTADETENHQT
jgi:hypothetical protein